MPGPSLDSICSDFFAWSEAVDGGGVGFLQALILRENRFAVSAKIGFLRMGKGRESV